MARRAQLLLCLALAARIGWAQNTSNSSNSSSNATPSPPPPPANATLTPRPPPPANTAPSGAGVVTSEQLWKLQDNQCGVRVLRKAAHQRAPRRLTAAQPRGGSVRVWQRPTSR